MSPVAIAFAVTVPAAFFAGVLTAKFVISEAQSIKAHVSAEVAKVRNDVASLLSKAATKV